MMHSLWKFHEMFWQVCGNIYWNISRKLLLKILEILHKILQKLFCKVSGNIQISVINFLNQYFHKLAQIFSERLREMLRKLSHNYYREGFWNSSEIFCEWFGQRTQPIHEMFLASLQQHLLKNSRKLPIKILKTLHKILQKLLQSFSKYSYLGHKLLEPIFP